MNKQTLIIVGAVIGVILIGFVGFKVIGGGKKAPTPIPTPVVDLKPVDESVSVNLTPNDAKKEVTIMVSGMAGRYSAIEYELAYNTADKGRKGALSGNKPIPLDAGADTFTRLITLGTESRNVYTYDNVVGAISLSVKFHLPNGSSEYFKKDFEI